MRYITYGIIELTASSILVNEKAFAKDISCGYIKTLATYISILFLEIFTSKSIPDLFLWVYCTKITEWSHYYSEMLLVLV